MTKLNPENTAVSVGADPTCTLTYCLDFIRQDFTETTPLGLLFSSIASQLERPIVPRTSSVQDALNEKLLASRESLEAEFETKYPAHSLRLLWEMVQDSNKEIPVIKAMQEECFSAFVNATYWCYAKEGTRQTGRFSIDRLWRAASVDRNVIEKHIRPMEYSSVCGACQKEAHAKSWSATAKSASRVTTIQCSHCGHVDNIGRNTYSKLSDPWDFAARLACQCSTCDSIRNEAIATAKNRLEQILISESVMIANRTYSEHQHIGRRRQSSRFSRSKEGTVYEKVVDLIAQGNSLPDSLLTAGIEEVPGLKNDNYRLAHILDIGISEGWLELSGIKIIEPKAELEKACMTSIDLLLSAYGEYSLSALRSDVQSGDIHKLINAIRNCTYIYRDILPPLSIDVRLIGADERAEILQEDVLASRSSSQNWQRQPERDSHLEFVSASRATAFAKCAQLMKQCAAEVDKTLGEGTASRCPELVQEMMAHIRTSE